MIRYFSSPKSHVVKYSSCYTLLPKPAYQKHIRNYQTAGFANCFQVEKASKNKMSIEYKLGLFSSPLKPY